MANAGDGLDDYPPDSDDSHDEDKRPNRWTGPPSTWQQLNSAEINTLTALNEIRNQDLSIHLYKAFALRHRHDERNNTAGAAKPVPNQDIDAVTEQPVQEDRWVPPKSWTAWPLPASVVPRPDFMKRTDVADERHAFRMQVPYRPRTELEETVSATILRVAKEKFRARQAAQEEEKAAVLNVEGSEDDDDDDDDDGDGDGGNDSGAETSSAPRRRVRSKSGTRSASRPRSMKFESTSGGEMMDVDGPPTIHRSSSIMSPTPPDMPLLKTVVATDDELSYSLLRPSTQRILAKLDATLTILHTAQESQAQTRRPSESGASDASSRPRSRARSRSRPRRHVPTKPQSQSPAAKRARPATSRTSSTAEASGPPEPPTEARRPGRPRKVYPRLDGETERAYVVRIARLRKKPIPYFPDDDDDDDDPEPPSDSTPVPRSAAEPTDVVDAGTTKSRTRQSRRGRRRREADAEPYRKQRFERVRLRDWRDILGAAALAGFPSAALDRAAQRCADLFGEGLTLHTIQEPFPGQTKSDRHVRYEPGIAAPRVLEDDSDAADDDGGPSQQPPRGRRRRRSKSAAALSGGSRARSASSAGQHFCTVDHCPRAVEPFARRANLLRHLRLVHGYDGDEVPVEADDSEDGFLKPIRVRPGWRADDAVKGKGKGNMQRRKRTRDGESEGEGMGDTNMRDADSTSGREMSD